MAATIGIKLANGDFYSIMEENSVVKKRLVLTTAHNNQKSVQIDFYKSIIRSMIDAMYIGTLVVNHIGPVRKEEPSIELVISSTADGVITAESTDLGNPARERQQLSLSLRSFEEDPGDYSGFEIEDERADAENGAANQDFYDQPDSNGEKKFPWKIVIIIGLILALLCLALWFFLFKNGGIFGGSGASGKAQTAPPSAPAAAEAPRTPPEPPKAAETAPPAAAETAAPAEPPKAAESATAETAAPKAAEPAKPEIIDTPPPEPQAAADPALQSRRRIAPVSSYKVPQTIPAEGVVYKIRWQDTLWDIADAFYRNPWLWTRIARHNRIQNPDLIVSGTEITIPPRNAR